ncbi:hypothetical protein PAMP_005817 [Pampus punctatissimus]
MQATLKKGNFFQHLVSLNRMSHLCSRARRPLCLSTFKQVFYFIIIIIFCLHMFVVHSLCFSVSSLIWVFGWAPPESPQCSFLFIGRMMRNVHLCRHVKKTEKRMQQVSEPTRAFLPSNIPAGHQMMWD